MFELRSKNILLMLTATLVSLNLHAITPSDLLTKTKWHSLFGNSLEINKDSLKIDQFVFPFSRANESIKYFVDLSDSSFLHTISYHNKTDTLLYFRYQVSSDSLLIEYLPSWSKIDNNGNLSCSFTQSGLCRLVEKELTYYSKEFLKKNKKQFILRSITNDATIGVQFHLQGDGSFKVHTNNKKSGASSIDYRKTIPLYGTYSGKLSTESMDSIFAYLNSEKGLKSYQIYHNRPKKRKDAYTSPFLKIEGLNEPIYLKAYELNRLIIDRIFFHKCELLYNGLKGEGTPQEVVVQRNSTVLPSYNNHRWYGKEAIGGSINLIKTLRVKDSVNYVYQMLIDSIYSENKMEVKVGDNLCFISSSKIVEDKVGIIYSNRSGTYHTLKWRTKHFNYNVVDSCFSVEQHILFEYRYRNSPTITRKEISLFRRYYDFYPRRPNNYNRFYPSDELIAPRHFYSQMEYKIYKATKKFQ